MKTQNGQLTKAYEKAMFDRFVRETPEGYVKTILADIQMEMERAIDSDFGFISFKERMEEIEQHRQEMIQSRKVHDDLKRQVVELQRTKDQLEYGIDKLRNLAGSFAKL